jgi:hypothetical protein
MSTLTLNLEAPREALGYEMWMMHRTQEQITAWDDPDFKKANPDKLFLHHAVLESFLVHARSLLYFFYPSDNPHSDDVLPRDFFTDGIHWSHSRASISSDAASWLEGINKALQHISKRRRRPRIEWNEQEIRGALDSLFAEFNRLGPIGGPVVVEHPGRLLQPADGS